MHGFVEINYVYIVIRAAFNVPYKYFLAYFYLNQVTGLEVKDFV
jgi:hypothetical protein